MSIITATGSPRQWAQVFDGPTRAERVARNPLTVDDVGFCTQGATGSFVETRAMLRSGRTFSIDGTEIAFSEWGNPQGPPVVLIHGWIFSRLAFERQTRGKLAEQCRIVAYDLRGHGESGKPENPAAYSDGHVWVADLDCVLQAVGIERPVLSGWSLGGRVAAHYVFARGPERVAGINLVSTRVLQPTNVSESGATGVVEEVASGSFAESFAGTTRFIRNCTHLPLSEDECESFVAAAMSVPPVARRGASAWHIDYGSFFDDLRLPVLVTHGGTDSVTSPLAAQTIARRLRGQLSIFPACGHMPFWEQPLRFDHELAQFAAKRSIDPAL